MIWQKWKKVFNFGSTRDADDDVDADDDDDALLLLWLYFPRNPLSSL